MTIKQYGGVFGRNPTFNNVTVDGTLTVDQIVEKTGAAGITLDGVTLKDGNVVLANGKGIDFSATSGTGTSELFDDYEEGLFVPTLTTDGTDFDAVSIQGGSGGRYVKIGSMVHVQLYLRTSSVTIGSASGNVVIGGLPFASVSNSSRIDGPSALAVGRVSDWAGEQPDAARVNAGSTEISLYYRSTSDAASSSLAPSDVDTGSNKNTIYIAGTYVTA